MSLNLYHERLAMKRLIPLVLTVVALAAGCSSDVKTDGDKSPTETNASMGVSAKPIATPAFTEGVTYTDFTNTEDRAISTLWFKAESKTDSGTVDIQRCEEDWAANGSCKSGAKTVLPSVDLPGWRLWLASGATALEPDETAHLKFEVKGTTADVVFNVASKAPKD